MVITVLILALVTLQRLSELLLAKRNTSRLLAMGAKEMAHGHYPVMVVMHAAWLAGLWVLAPGRSVFAVPLVAYLLLQPMRLWILATLGPRWTTRIIILPGAPLVRHGPYRFISHPNYVVVVAEIALLPLAFGLPWFALLFSLANAAVLFVRIRSENEALAGAAPVEASL
ncbi:isoprenylcysteine carboxylmethyltransferase family protein [Xanthobacter sp. DSM 24535]|uniref:isoprenylcysteine carboxyl methyltransferase family protein n=1 Tax=Roseixanthobacter psychrophilus TaxID=3119917 RepID=UPI00372A8B15